MVPRPPVSVVVPFRGGRGEAERMLDGLSRFRLRGDDELIVADNTAGGVVARVAGEPVRIARATAERSSYHARNVGARAAANDWLLFVDADCTPAAGLLDAYFAEPVSNDCGAVSGLIVGDPAQRGLLPRYARSRSFLRVDHGLLGRDATPAGNVLVRRAAFEAVGGFEEGIRSGGDIDLSRRLAAAGWVVEHRPAAVVTHRHRVRLTGFVGMIARYGSGARWLNERYPGTSPRWPLVSGLRGAARDAARLASRGRLESALFRAVDGLGLIAHNIGYLASNRAPGT
ncbi:MAG: glycosyltransferase [Actinomycetota bacterium]